jgi:uncharacterized protein YdbL (DUF1318 family)
MRTASLIGVLLLSACVTINIYFPAAAAEQVADEIIKEIQTEQHKDDQHSALPDLNTVAIGQWVIKMAVGVVDILIPPAHAEADLNVETPQIRQILAAMQGRFAQLSPLYSAAYIGIQNDGFIAAKDAAPLNERNRVNKLIAAENADRNRLYQAIADANGHPEWVGQIKSTFARRWIGNAQSGWWYQNQSGQWVKK